MKTGNSRGQIVRAHVPLSPRAAVKPPVSSSSEAGVNSRPLQYRAPVSLPPQTEAAAFTVLTSPESRSTRGQSVLPAGSTVSHKKNSCGLFVLKHHDHFCVSENVCKTPAAAESPSLRETGKDTSVLVGLFKQ